MSSTLAAQSLINLEDSRVRKRKLKWTLDFEDEMADAILFLAQNGRMSWTLSEWNALVNSIKNSELTIGEWLDQRRGSTNV